MSFMGLGRSDFGSHWQDVARHHPIIPTREVGSLVNGVQALPALIRPWVHPS
jgi:hypothetical protein